MTGGEKGAWLAKWDAWQERLSRARDEMDRLENEAPDLMAACPMNLGEDRAQNLGAWLRHMQDALVSVDVLTDRIYYAVEHAEVSDG